MSRHALLLSGSLGMGHDVMAEAYSVSLRRRGWSSDTMNSLALMGGAAGGWGERVFRGLLSVPGLYDAFHFEQLRTGGRLARLAERASSRYAVPALTAELVRQPADLVISVFATGAAAASRVKAETMPGLRTVTFCTDVNPHSLWVHPNTDLYLVTSRTAMAFVRRFHPEAAVQVVPTPVRPPFYAAPSRAQARDRLGLPADEPCVLLMAGAWALGPLVDIATALADAGVRTLAVAGRNAATEAALRAAARTHARITPFGFTDEVPILMAAADAVITTSGDTCSEARVVGRHVVLLDTVPGHGRENLQHELERGDADVVPMEPVALVRGVRAVLDRLDDRPQRPAATVAEWDQTVDAALVRLELGDAEDAGRPG
jgi:UDP-N-acetylglucosamine:LPS N-acetylglucosamine transferase